MSFAVFGSDLTAGAGEGVGDVAAARAVPVVATTGVVVVAAVAPPGADLAVGAVTPGADLAVGAVTPGADLAVGAVVVAAVAGTEPDAGTGPAVGAVAPAVVGAPIVPPAGAGLAGLAARPESIATGAGIVL